MPLRLFKPSSWLLPNDVADDLPRCMRGGSGDNELDPGCFDLSRFGALLLNADCSAALGCAGNSTMALRSR